MAIKRCEVVVPGALCGGVVPRPRCNLVISDGPHSGDHRAAYRPKGVRGKVIYKWAGVEFRPLRPEVELIAPSADHINPRRARLV